MVCPDLTAVGITSQIPSGMIFMIFFFSLKETGLIGEKASLGFLTSF
jgi:hypothetical protein